MTTQKILFSPIPLDELKSVLSDIVKSEVKSELHELTLQKPSNELLSRKQTAKMLGVSLQSLYEWTIAGKIPAYRIGTRVRYKKDEIEQSLKKIGAQKNKVGGEENESN